MKNLIEYPLEDGTSLFIEVDQPEPEGGVVRAARPGEVLAKAGQTFEQAIDKVKPAASVIIQKLRSLHDAPDEIEVEFGLKMSAEAGAFIAAASVDANYTVTLKWKQPSETSSTPAKPT